MFSLAIFVGSKCANISNVTICCRFWKSVKDLRNVAGSPQLPSEPHSNYYYLPYPCVFIGSALEASSSIPRSSISFWDLASTAESSAAQGSWMNVLGSSRGYHTRSNSVSLTQNQLQCTLCAV